MNEAPSRDCQPDDTTAPLQLRIKIQLVGRWDRNRP